MLGAEMGTWADTLVANIGRSKEPIRAGVFHVAFNIASVCIGVILYKQLAALGAYL